MRTMTPKVTVSNLETSHGVLQTRPNGSGLDSIRSVSQSGALSRISGIENRSSGFYISQVPILRSQASSMNVDMSRFDKILEEKIKASKHMFSSESREYQKWWAECSVWMMYCKCIVALLEVDPS